MIQQYVMKWSFEMWNISLKQGAKTKLNPKQGAIIVFKLQIKGWQKEKKKIVQIKLPRISRRVVGLHLRVHKIVDHTAWLISHHDLFIGLQIVGNWLSSRSRWGSQVDLDLREVQVWEHEDGLFMEVLKLVPVITLHFIEIRLGSLILFNGLFSRFFHVLMKCSHFKFQMGIFFHQIFGLMSHPTQLSLQINHLLAKGLRRFLEFLQGICFGPYMLLQAFDRRLLRCTTDL